MRDFKNRHRYQLAIVIIAASQRLVSNADKRTEGSLGLVTGLLGLGLGEEVPELLAVGDRLNGLNILSKILGVPGYNTENILIVKGKEETENEVKYFEMCAIRCDIIIVIMVAMISNVA